MLFHCNTFKVFGDGGNRMILLATNSEGEQEAFIIHNPMVKALTIHNYTKRIEYGFSEQQYMINRPSSTTLELTAGECEFHKGINLDKRFDPIWSKSIKELFSIIDSKLNER